MIVSGVGLGAQSGAQSEAQSQQILHALQKKSLSMNELIHILGLKSKTGALKRTVGELLSEELIQYTLPDKPNSRLQKYQLAVKGNKLFEK